MASSSSSSSATSPSASASARPICISTKTDYLRNGDFESGALLPVWTTTTQTRLTPIVAQDASLVHSGEWLQRALGTSASGAGSLAQYQTNIAIPDGKKVLINFWGQNLRAGFTSTFSIALDGVELGRVSSSSGQWVQIGTGLVPYTVVGNTHRLDITASSPAARTYLFHIDDVAIVDADPPLCGQPSIGT
ncbi:hypothetical protein ACN47E_000547 [Coniothyrium glycines]